MISPEETRLDYAHVPHLAGVPRFMYRKALQHLRAMAHAIRQGESKGAFEHELWLCFFAGVLKQRVLTSRCVLPTVSSGAQGARC